MLIHRESMSKNYVVCERKSLTTLRFFLNGIAYVTPRLIKCPATRISPKRQLIRIYSTAAAYMPVLLSADPRFPSDYKSLVTHSAVVGSTLRGQLGVVECHSSGRRVRCQGSRVRLCHVWLLGGHSLLKLRLGLGWRLSIQTCPQRSGATSSRVVRYPLKMLGALLAGTSHRSAPPFSP